MPTSVLRIRAEQMPSWRGESMSRFLLQPLGRKHYTGRKLTCETRYRKSTARE